MVTRDQAAAPLAAPGLDELAVVTVYYCDNCGAASEEYAEKLYECNSCGTIFLKEDSDYDSHRCNCGIFASKLADMGCVECREAEVRETEAVECPNCGDFIHFADATSEDDRIETWDNHVRECYTAV